VRRWIPTARYMLRYPSHGQFARRLKFQWSPGLTGLLGNELADTFTKPEAEISSDQVLAHSFYKSHKHFARLLETKHDSQVHSPPYQIPQVDLIRGSSSLPLCPVNFLAFAAVVSAPFLSFYLRRRRILLAAPANTVHTICFIIFSTVLHPSLIGASSPALIFIFDL